MAPFVKPKIIRRANSVAKAGRRVIKAQDRYTMMSNIRQPRAVALDRRVGNYTGRMHGEKANAQLFEGRVQKSVSNQLAARANTARTVFENLMPNGRPTWVTGKAIEGYWKWRTKRNAKYQGLSLEREALMTQAVSSRKAGVKGVAKSQTTRAKGRVEVSKLQAERAMAKMVLAVPTAIKESKKSADWVTKERANLLRAFNAVPAAQRGGLTISYFDKLLKVVGLKLGRLRVNFYSSSNKSVQEDLSRKVARYREVISELKSLAENPHGVTLVGLTPKHNTILMAQLMEEIRVKL